MRLPKGVNPNEHPTTFIHVGGMFASRDPYLIRTILGSCVAVCLRDPLTSIGGMNHFMLPTSLGDHARPSAFGLQAMELLINRMMALGASRERLEAKVFGGGHVLKMDRSKLNVPEANLEWTFSFLDREQIPVLKSDVGGYAGREVFYFTDSGRTLVRKMGETGIDRSEISLYEFESKFARRSAERDENVTLFDRSENEASPRPHRR